MRCTPPLLVPGFWKRSLDEFRRGAGIALRMEAFDRPKRPFPLISFTEPDSVKMCKQMSDMDIGGFSAVNMDYIEATEDEPSHARWHGSISTQLPTDRPEIQRTGYAGWRTLDRGFSIFGKSVWDLDAYTYLALRVKSDGRKYFVNLQTESIVPTDLHQHRLYAQKPGEWETILIGLNDFVRTNHGIVVEPQSELLRQKVTSVGISSTDRMPGPYELCISGVWATNKQIEDAARERERAERLGISQETAETLRDSSQSTAL
ncbi:CIA30-domain-containing protein [Rhizodiscina lignyota]|uniref:CIA30-domain-containing protein n=1 Tax=Rhizodiscina lignyota TaxID=1504668 RepID=A0A9P4ITG7_9PEZI|nr:CIA30-domain-containing protein [Rhizodiscina lignyota]